MKTIFSIFDFRFSSMKQKGISLMELLIIMSIIGIVTAISIPTVRNYLPSLRLSSSANLVISKLREAQEEAITTQIRHGIKFNSSTNPPTIDLIKVESTETVTQTFTLGQDITLTLNGITNDRLIFSSDGGLSNGSTPGTITIALDANSKIANVSAGGMIKLQ